MRIISWWERESFASFHSLIIYVSKGGLFWNWQFLLKRKCACWFARVAITKCHIPGSFNKWFLKLLGNKAALKGSANSVFRCLFWILTAIVWLCLHTTTSLCCLWLIFFSYKVPVILIQVPILRSSFQTGPERNYNVYTVWLHIKCRELELQHTHFERIGFIP